MKQLQTWGIEFKMFKPPGTGWGSMHAKTWVCDGEVYLGGSANFTNNSMTNSLEHVVIVKDDAFITKYLEWFEGLWAIAEEIKEDS